MRTLRLYAIKQTVTISSCSRSSSWRDKLESTKSASLIEDEITDFLTCLHRKLTVSWIGHKLIDREIEQQLQRLQVHNGEPAKGKKRSRARNAPKFDLRTQLLTTCRVDSARIDGIDVTTVLAVIAKTGPDQSCFPTVGHFTSWLGLCPGTKINGGKVMSNKTKHVTNRTAQALRLATALRSDQSALCAYFRRLCAHMPDKFFIETN